MHSVHLGVLTCHSFIKRMYALIGKEINWKESFGGGGGPVN